MRRLFLFASIALCSSCASVGKALNKVVPIFGADGDQVGEAEVGDLLANSGVVDTLGSLVGGAMGNPMIGTAAAAGLGGFLLNARRKAKAKAGK